MASAKTRAPAGARRVATALWHEMAAIPDGKHREVERAALRMIREAAAVRRAKEKATKPKPRRGPAPHRAIRPGKPMLVSTVADQPKAKVG